MLWTQTCIGQDAPSKTKEKKKEEEDVDMSDAQADDPHLRGPRASIKKRAKSRYNKHREADGEGDKPFRARKRKRDDKSPGDDGQLEPSKGIVNVKSPKPKRSRGEAAAPPTTSRPVRHAPRHVLTYGHDGQRVF